MSLEPRNAVTTRKRPSGDAAREEQLLLLRALVGQRVLVLGLAQAVVVDLAVVVLVPGGDGPRPGETAVEEALLVRSPGQARELRPRQMVGPVRAGGHVAHEDLLPVAAALRERVGHEGPVPGHRGGGEGDRTVGGERVGVEEHPLEPGQTLPHEQDGLVLEPGVAEVEVAARVPLRDGDPWVVEQLLQALLEGLVQGAAEEGGGELVLRLDPGRRLGVIGVLQPPVRIGYLRPLIVIHHVGFPRRRVLHGLRPRGAVRQERNEPQRHRHVSEGRPGHLVSPAFRPAPARGPG